MESNSFTNFLGYISTIGGTLMMFIGFAFMLLFIALMAWPLIKGWSEGRRERREHSEAARFHRSSARPR